MKRTICLCLWLLQCLLFCCVYAQQDEGLYTATVSKDMTIRKTKSTSGQKLGEVHAGDLVTITEYGEQWSHVVTSRAEGYILSKNVIGLTAAGGSSTGCCSGYSRRW